MQVKIESCYKIDDLYTVEFSCKHGCGYAIWHSYSSSNEKPVVGKTYLAEVDIPGILEWGKDITKSGIKNFSMDVVGENKILMVAQIEGIEDVLIIRFGSDCVFMLETNTVKAELGDFVRIETDKLSLYEYYPFCIRDEYLLPQRP